ncbi:MAG: hypothetical protein P1V20_26860 [Verrucomicrobiales bacterium]|nr:hypothetical protein [Verrucomicrobiales bacterium]
MSKGNHPFAILAGAVLTASLLVVGLVCVNILVYAFLDDSPASAEATESDISALITSTER